MGVTPVFDGPWGGWTRATASGRVGRGLRDGHFPPPGSRFALATLPSRGGTRPPVSLAIRSKTKTLQGGSTMNCSVIAKSVFLTVALTVATAFGTNIASAQPI